MSYQFADQTDFLKIWDRCSPSLTHLKLKYWSKSTAAFPPTQHTPSYIRLQSLDIGKTTASGGLRDWLTHPLCPFDFSCIKHLAVGTNTDLLFSHKFAPGLETIETLEVYTERGKPPLDLSLLPTLALLRITIRVSSDAWQWIYPTLSTITSRNRSIKIIFVGAFHGTTPEEFDSHLSTLSISPIIELQMAANAITPNLPRLTSANLLRRAKYDEYFFQFCFPQPEFLHSF
ncbi:hypothetical protein C8R44DRAFT_854606 [Mycena epipterygia]|nr:hypothetical protein C8R44DRAFT_854606 [Mycena epipterygia]